MLHKDKIKSITLEMTNYLVRGTAYITCWDGTCGEIGMKEYHSNSLNFEEIFDGVNDNGFGCSSIDKVHFRIYENYDGYLVPYTNFIIDKFPCGYGKRGV